MPFIKKITVLTLACALFFSNIPNFNSNEVSTCGFEDEDVCDNINEVY